ncbi:CaiB/BaiF CoA transferase family protein [Hymenobacter sp. BT491]|uniref:CaiB/BaiF CoA transferase family protein n=1 Tax=Hymenobacter sp. BT491 TaxID=2766779 RepID=UPI001653E709|nr:CaiB/BaiF CoA-transferase family protein [Hymenobacter sp. BT491]MBC6989232.1 CoA transferase [Hymenobacter sp. BT491]
MTPIVSAQVSPTANELPFKGLVIIELASVLAGPQVGQFFAELGATVLKIEHAAQGGDVTRSWKTSAEPADTDVSAYFSSSNWGKQSVALDLTTAEGRAAIHTLIARADVVLASYKPGDAEKLCVDYETLANLNPQLIYGHITGYGPEVHRAGYDAVLQAEAGFMHLNALPGQAPLKMPVAMVDLLTAHQLKEGLLTALYRRARTGQGALVQVSLLDSALASLANQGTGWLVTGHDPQPMGSGHPSIVPYGTVYQAADGRRLVLAIGSDRQFQQLCAALGRPSWATDLRFATNSLRVTYRNELEELLQERIREVNGAELLLALEQRAVPAGAVRTVGEALTAKSAQHMLLPPCAAFPYSGLRTVAFRSNAWPVMPALSAPPHIGQQSAAVLNQGDEGHPQLKNDVFS